ASAGGRRHGLRGSAPATVGPVPDLDALPHWPEGTVAWLVTYGDASSAPHAIPVSTALRTGPRCVLLALSRRRGSLRRLRQNPHVALAVIAPGVAFTAQGLAAVATEPLPGAQRAAAVTINVARIQNHAHPTFVLDDGPRWHWTDEDARQADAATRAALQAFAYRA
ncbi:MAG: hypothetical protein M3370_03065, partial [Actinomycetota bacterium]|nr:hypothetical protein [Actinomycetota bacterium]